jgi:thiamine pyrophosphate-dependent acetolactate synthase large subunit-like protein
MEQAMIDRREFVRALLADRGGLIVVTGLGSSTYDVAAVGDHPLNVYQWGGMGGTLMVGLGLALARRDHRVAVITGDGDALMGIGSLATIGVKQPENLSVVVLDNGHYGETGMQASHTQAGVDLVAVARACRFRDAYEVDALAAAGSVRDLLHKAQGPVLVRALVKRDALPRVLPTRDGQAIRIRLAAALGA